MAAETVSPSLEPVFIIVKEDYYADPEKKRQVITSLETPPINFVLERDLPRLGVLYGKLEPANIELAQEVPGVKLVTTEGDSGMGS